MDYEYEHINDIDKFRRNIRNYNVRWMPDIIRGISEDDDLAESEKNELYNVVKASLRENIKKYPLDEMQDFMNSILENNNFSDNQRNDFLDIIGNGWEDLNREDIDRQERERIERRNAERFAEGRRRQEENRERRRNRNVSEFENDELLSQYNRLNQDIERMVSASHGRRDSKTTIDRYNAMKARRDEVIKEINTRGLKIEKNDNEFEFTRKQRDKIESEYIRNKKIREMSSERILEEERDLKELIEMQKNELGRSASLKPDKVSQLAKQLAENKVKLSIIKKFVMKNKSRSELENYGENLNDEMKKIRLELDNNSNLTPKLRLQYQNRLKEIEKEKGEINKALANKPKENIEQENNQPANRIEENPKATLVDVQQKKADSAVEENDLYNNRTEAEIMQEKIERARAKAEEKRREERKRKEAEEEARRKIEERKEKENDFADARRREEEKNAKLKEEIEASRKKEKKSIILRIGALIAAGITAVTIGIGTIWNRIHNDKVRKLLPIQLIDEKVPGNIKDGSNDNPYLNIKDNQSKDNYSIEKQIEEQINEQIKKQNKEKEDNNKFKEDLKVTDEQSEQLRKENEKNVEEKALEEFELGSIMKLPRGIKYRESVFGGKEGEIGNSGSPEDGIYVINRYAEISDTEVSNQYGLNGKIERNIENSDLFVHIAYVPGAKTEEEAKKILENSKDKKEYDRGWIKMSDLQKAVEKQKQQESQKQR